MEKFRTKKQIQNELKDNEYKIEDKRQDGKYVYRDYDGNVAVVDYTEKTIQYYHDSEYTVFTY